METTLENLKANDGRIAISVYDAQNLQGYQIKCKTEYVSEGEVVDSFKKAVENVFDGAATAKGALIMNHAQVRGGFEAILARRGPLAQVRATFEIGYESL